MPISELLLAHLVATVDRLDAFLSAATDAGPAATAFLAAAPWDVDHLADCLLDLQCWTDEVSATICAAGAA